MKTVIVIGGGASGLVAALSAAADKQNRVLLLERQQRLGRKLLATGNGRCNLTNTAASPAHYHGEDPAFVTEALARFTPGDTLAFFRSLGLLTVEEYGGRVYPLSDSANSVLDVLRFAVERAGVEVHAPCCVTEVKRAGRSALVQLVTATDYPRSLKGVRADAAVTLRRGSEILARSEGEVQFTDNGVSGPAVFDVSRAASCGGEGVEISFDFFRGRDSGELMGMLRARRAALPKAEVGDLLTGMLHNRLGRMLVKAAGFRGDVPLYAGGVSTAQFDPRTMQSRLVPGLYACGEVLDIDGDCGGYNLQWAWSSGVAAGRLET